MQTNELPPLYKALPEPTQELINSLLFAKPVNEMAPIILKIQAILGQIKLHESKDKLGYPSQFVMPHTPEL